MQGTKIAGFRKDSLADYDKLNTDVAYHCYVTFLKRLLVAHPSDLN